MPVHCVKHDRHRAVNTSKCKQPFVMGNVENPSLFVHRQADHFPTKGTSHCSDGGAGGLPPRCGTRCLRGKARGPRRRAVGNAVRDLKVSPDWHFLL